MACIAFLSKRPNLITQEQLETSTSEVQINFPQQWLKRVMRGTELLLCQGKKELADELFCSSIKLKSADQKSSSHRVLKNLTCSESR